MNFTSLFLKIFLPWEPPPGSPPPPPNLPLDEDHRLHPSAGLRGSSGGPPPPLPSPQLCLPGLPGETRRLGSEALWLRAGEEEGM